MSLGAVTLFVRRGYRRSFDPPIITQPVHTNIKKRPNDIMTYHNIKFQCVSTRVAPMKIESSIIITTGMDKIATKRFCHEYYTAIGHLILVQFSTTAYAISAGFFEELNCFC